MLIDVYNGNDWVNVESDEADPTEFSCSECGEVAEEFTEISTPDPTPSFWAQCRDCAHYTHCDSQHSAWFEEAAYGRD